jgi:hypothetical protein
MVYFGKGGDKMFGIYQTYKQGKYETYDLIWVNDPECAEKYHDEFDLKVPGIGLLLPWYQPTTVTPYKGKEELKSISEWLHRKTIPVMLPYE